MNDKNSSREELLRNDSSDDIKKLIKVVSPKLWMLLTGGILIIAMFSIWMFRGVMASYVTGSAIYHPGASEYGEILCFMNLNNGKSIEKGMRAACYVSGVDQQEYGHMSATVTYVDPYVTSADRVRELLGDDSLASVYTQNGPIVLIVCKIDADISSENGYKWTNEKGNEVVIEDGSLISLSIVTNNMTPYEYFTD